MVIIQGKSLRSPSGGRLKQHRKKKQYDAGGTPTHTRIDEVKQKNIVTLGNNRKTKLLAGNIVNLHDPKTKTTSKATIKIVVENTANRHFVRRNILTKGTVIETDKGKAKVTSRPGQNGIVSAVLIK